MPTFPYPNQRYTTSLGLSLFGMDEVLADNMNLIDEAYGAGSSINVNGTLVTSPNLNNTTPTAPASNTNVTWQVDANGNISAYVPTSGGGGAVTSVFGRTGAVVAVATDYGTVGIDGQDNNLTIQTTDIGSITITDTKESLTIGPFGNGATLGDLGGNAFTVTGFGPGAQIILGSGPPSMFLDSTDIIDFIPGSPTGEVIFTATQANFSNKVMSKAVIGFSTATTMDAGFSRLGAASVALGNGSQGDFSGNLKATTINVITGYQVNGGATSGQYLRGDGTNFVPSTIQSGDLPAGTGTVTSFSAGDLNPLFTTSVATPSTTPALSFSLSNASGGTVFGNNTASAGAPAYTTTPVLGIPGTSTGSIALASSTASGKFTITAPASAATPTLTLPTTSNVLAGQYAGDNVIYTSTLQTANAAGTLTPSLLTQTANTVLAGPTSGGAATPTFRALVTADLPAGTGTVTSVSMTGDGVVYNASVTGSPITTSGTLVPSLIAQVKNTFFSGPTTGVNATPTFRAIGAGDIPSGTVTWDQIGSAAGSLTLANAGFNTIIQNTSQSNFLQLVNITAATSGASRTSPQFNIVGKYWTGAASASDTWTIQDVIANGTNGTSYLTFTHSGSSGATGLSIPAGASGATSLQFAGGTSGIWGTTSAVNLDYQTSGGTVGFYVGSTQEGTIGNGGSVFTFASTANNQPVAVRSATISGGNVTNTALQLNFGNSLTNSGSGVQTAVGTSPTFAPVSGSSAFVGLGVTPTINQTSTSSGNYTGLLVNVTETSLKGSANKLLSLQAGSTGGTTKFEVNNSGIVDNYNGIATVSGGVPSEYATVDLTAQSAAIAATTAYAATATGMYRITWSADITTAATTSSVLGGTAGFQILYTSPTDSVVKTTVSGNSVTSAANTTGTAVGGTLVVYAKTGTNIQYQYDYTSVGVTAMVYELHIKVEAL